MRCFFLLLWVLSVPIFSNPYSDKVYKEIKDIYNPTIKDYQKIENYLKKGKRPFLYRLDHWQYRKKVRKFKMSPRNSSEKIVHEIIPVNCSIEDKENCIYVFSSFNYCYPKGVENLVKYIKESDFKGHIICRIGGFPNQQFGDLVMAHIPYSFKVCAIKEAMNLGYKKVLWLDAPMIPQVSLNTIFDKMDKKPFFFYLSAGTLSNLERDWLVFRDLGLTYAQARVLQPVLLGVFGFNLEDEKVVNLINFWHEKTRRCERLSFSRRLETTLLTAIFHRFGVITKEDKQYDIFYYIPTKENPEFYYDKTVVQPDWPN